MGQRPLTTERAAERRQQLLDAALEVFSQRDFDEVSVDEIAEAAGVSHGLIFQYFGTKKDLYITIVEPLIEQFRARVRPDLDKPPAERLRDSIRTYSEIISQHPDGYRFLLTRGTRFAEVREELQRARLSAVGRIAPQMGLDPDRPDVRVGILGWIGYQESAMLNWLERGEPDVETLIDLIAGALGSTAQALGATLS